jgi:hypothetical protein
MAAAWDRNFLAGPGIVVFEGEGDFAPFKKLDTFAPCCPTQAGLDEVRFQAAGVKRLQRDAMQNQLYGRGSRPLREFGSPPASSE